MLSKREMNREMSTGEKSVKDKDECVDRLEICAMCFKEGWARCPLSKTKRSGPLPFALCP